MKCNAHLGRLMIQDVFDLSLKSTKVLRDLHDSCCYAIHSLQINSFKIRVRY